MNRSDNAKCDSEVDTVFKNALHKYHGQLLFTFANAIQVHFFCLFVVIYCLLNKNSKKIQITIKLQ